MSKTVWIVISGLVWFIVGIGLLSLGMNFILSQVHFPQETSSSLFALLVDRMGGREEAALGLIVVALIAGFIKGRFVLVKTTRRVVARIVSLSEPIRFFQVYGKGYLFLIGGMVGLGMSMKWFHLPLEIRGFVDVAVGSALMNGASAYFRAAIAHRRSVKKAL